MQTSRTTHGIRAMLALAAVSALAAASSPQGRIVEVQTVVNPASEKAQPAQQNKQTPRDSKTSRLLHRQASGSKAGRGKRVSHTVAHGRRLARKARNVKRHRARA